MFETREERDSITKQLEDSAEKMGGVPERKTFFAKEEEKPRSGSLTKLVAKATELMRMEARRVRGLSVEERGRVTDSTGRATEPTVDDEHFIPEINGRSSIDWSFANFTHISAQRTTYAPLPEEHNTASHEAILSRQRTSYTGGPSIQKDAPVTSFRSVKYSEPGRSTRFCKYIGHRLKLGKLSLRNCISQRSIWVRERFRKSKPEEKTKEWRQMSIPTIVIQRSSSELGTSIASGDQEFAHDVERSMAGDVFGYERGYLARERFVID